MSDAIDWNLLQKQYFSDDRYFNLLSKMCKIVDDPCSSDLSKIYGNDQYIMK